MKDILIIEINNNLSVGVDVVLLGSSSGRRHWATCRDGAGRTRGSCALP